MKDNRALEQVYRLDGKNCFIEVMLSGLPYDKLLMNFKQYDGTKAAGNRTKGDISIFLNVYEAQRLSRDIMSGRISKLGKLSKEKALKEKKKYTDAVFSSQGGTPAKNRPDGVAQARTFELSTGASQAWVLCAKQGKAHETAEGLIVMDGVPEVTIRVPASDDKLKEIALAIETTVRIWEQLRFLPVAKPMMKAALERKQEVINNAKASRN